MILTFDRFELDLERRVLRRRGRDAEVQPLVFDVLSYLARNSNRVVPKEELVERVWNNVVVGDGAISQAIFLVRRALDETGRVRHFVRTVRGRGYCLKAEVQEQKGVARLALAIAWAVFLVPVC